MIKLLSIVLILLSGCTQKSYLSYDKYPGHFKIGKPYEINKVIYTPKNVEKKYTQEGIASWYSDQFHGKKTANGDFFDKRSLTAAHPTLPLPSIVKVTNLDNKKSLIVMVSDRGPFKNGRVIDLSEFAAKELGFKNKGITKVRIDYLAKESKALLKKIGIEPKHGSIARKKIQDKRCDLNCFLKKLNKSA